MLSEGRVRRVHTHTLHFPPVFVNISRHSYPSVILIPLFLCLFVSSFGYQPASRRKQLPSRAASYTSPRTFSRRHPISQWIFKNIHIYTTRIAQRSSSFLFTRFWRSSIAERGRWKEIFFPDSKLEKPSAGKKSRCRTCAEACHSRFKDRADWSCDTFQPMRRRACVYQQTNQNIAAVIKYFQNSGRSRTESVIVSRLSGIFLRLFMRHTQFF